MKFETRISKMTKDDCIIHGEKLSKLVDKGSFADAAFLMLRGSKPSKEESIIFEALLTSMIDHGMGTASSMATRFVGSTGNPLNTSVAAGVLALGDFHGGAIEKAMEQLRMAKDQDNTETWVKHMLDEKKTLYGFGHKIYKDVDPRTKQLIAITKKVINKESKTLKCALAIEKEIEKQKGKKLVLNIDGCAAALLLDMGFEPNVGKGIFILARIPSLIAQAVEEKEYEKPVRRVDETDITYLGK